MTGSVSFGSGARRYGRLIWHVSRIAAASAGPPAPAEGAAGSSAERESPAASDSTNWQLSEQEWAAISQELAAHGI